MTGDHARALVLVGALVTGGSLVGVQPGHAPTAPVSEVRTIKAPPAAPLAKLAPVEKVPLPAPRPKIEAKPKPKAEPRPLKKSLPSCAYIRREQARMSFAEQWSAYLNASPEEIAHGKRCLGI